MGINFAIYGAYAVTAFILASGLLLKLPPPILSIVDFFYIGFPAGVLGGFLLVLRVGVGLRLCYTVGPS